MRDPAHKPYVGPRPFETGDRRLFFGRERETEDLLSLIMFHRTVLLYAQSGAGKSSLINTSIAPGLREAGFHVLPVARVRGAPTAAPPPGANIYVLNAVNTIDGTAAARLLEAGAPLGLETFLRQVTASATTRAPVLVFDQFEELFTAHQERWPDREGFFQQVAESLDAIPALRVVFSMREDFIAELDPLVWKLPEGIGVRYRLELLRHDAAVAAVVEPPRLFGVAVELTAAEKLVGDLLQINVEGPGGRPQRVQGEYVEPVQLQIVGSRLWERLPDEVDRITEAHFEQFGDVSHALREFYATTVREASRATGYPEKLIHLGCMQFVTSSGTRSLVHRDEVMTGLLPNPVVDSLVDQHFLRAEVRAGARWYEISHDRLIEPVHEKKQADEELKTLLRTRDLLAAAVEQWKARPDFVEDRHILTALSEVKHDLVLSDSELEFLGMNSIGAGFEVPAWIGRLRAQAPALLEEILSRASRHPGATIRRNATTALGEAGLESAETTLMSLAIEDADPEVRERAAVALAAVDRTALNERLLGLLAVPGRRRRALTALARMRNESVTRVRAEHLERAWSALPLADRAVLGLTLARVRLEKAWPTLVYVATFGALGAALFCGPARMLPGMWGLTVTQSRGSPTSALFQGAAGGIVWGGAVAACLALGWILFRGGGGVLTRRNVGNVLCGLLGGVVGGIGVFAEIFLVFDTDVLVRLGWIPAGGGHDLGACVAQTGYCLFHPGLGPAFGVGIGIALSALHRSPHWRRVIDPHVQAGRIVDWGRTLRRIVVLSALFSLPTAALLYGSALLLIATFGLDVARTVGETGTILAGNIGAVAGIVFGQLIMRVGITIPPRAD